jgi:hypothetical protein
MLEVAVVVISPYLAVPGVWELADTPWDRHVIERGALTEFMLTIFWGIHDLNGVVGLLSVKIFTFFPSEGNMCQ